MSRVKLYSSFTQLRDIRKSEYFYNEYRFMIKRSETSYKDHLDVICSAI